MPRHTDIVPHLLRRLFQTTIKRVRCSRLRYRPSVKNLILLMAILLIGYFLNVQRSTRFYLSFASHDAIIRTTPKQLNNITLTKSKLITQANATIETLNQSSNYFERRIRNKTPSSGLIVNQHSRDVDCHLGVPCVYPDNEVVDFRIIVLTYERKKSLIQLFASLEDLDMDGDVGVVEIWIDRAKNNTVSKEVFECAKNFNWTKGRVRVHVQEKHVGLLGQWIDTWRPSGVLPGSAGQPPRSKNNLPGVGELVLVLEDDMTISQYAYRWLKAAHHFYANRTDLAGLTLQSEGIIVARSGGYLKPPADGIAFLYRYTSSWGFAPRAKIWSGFQDWYHNASADPLFRPYVPHLVPTQWYKIFEKRRTRDSMWTMWFIYYCHPRRLYTLYSNIKSLTSDGKTCCLAVNRRERGLHYKGKGIKNDVRVRSACLTCAWKEEYLNFTHKVTTLKYDGKPIPAVE